MNARVLVVEDEISMRMLVHRALAEAGFAVTTASTAAEARRLFDQLTFDLVILDLMLPDGHGFDVCRKIRERSSTPVIMLTSRGEVRDVVEGLSIGADDYIRKPVDVAELQARAKAHLRRAETLSNADTHDRIAAGRLVIDSDNRDAWIDGERVNLSPREFEVLHYLAERLERPVDADALFDHVWGGEERSAKILAVYIRRLRMKIERDPDQPRQILTVKGVGYRLCRAD